jgi:hypothetical protein
VLVRALESEFSKHVPGLAQSDISARVDRISGTRLAAFVRWRTNGQEPRVASAAGAEGRLAPQARLLRMARGSSAAEPGGGRGAVLRAGERPPRRSTRSWAEGDSCSGANQMRPHQSRSGRKRAGSNPGTCVVSSDRSAQRDCLSSRLPRLFSGDARPLKGDGPVPETGPFLSRISRNGVGRFSRPSAGRSGSDSAPTKDPRSDANGRVPVGAFWSIAVRLLQSGSMSAEGSGK